MVRRWVDYAGMDSGWAVSIPGTATAVTPVRLWAVLNWQAELPAPSLQAACIIDLPFARKTTGARSLILTNDTQSFSGMARHGELSSLITYRNEDVSPWYDLILLGDFEHFFFSALRRNKIWNMCPQIFVLQCKMRQGIMIFRWVASKQLVG